MVKVSAKDMNWGGEGGGWKEEMKGEIRELLKGIEKEWNVKDKKKSER